MLKSKEKARLIRKIETTKRIIAEERDKIREYLHDLEAIGESCDQAYDSLDNAADILSQYL